MTREHARCGHSVDAVALGGVSLRMVRPAGAEPGRRRAPARDRCRGGCRRKRVAGACARAEKGAETARGAKACAETGTPAAGAAASGRTPGRGRVCQYEESTVVDG